MGVGEQLYGYTLGEWWLSHGGVPMQGIWRAGRSGYSTSIYNGSLHKAFEYHEDLQKSFPGRILVSSGGSVMRYTGIGLEPSPNPSFRGMFCVCLYIGAGAIYCSTQLSLRRNNSWRLLSCLFITRQY